MRVLIALGVVAFGVGLAAQWWPRALGEGAAAKRAGEVRTPLTSATSSSGERASEAPAAPDEGVVAASAYEPLTEDQADAPAEPAPDRMIQLISAGFTPERAHEIVRKESELRQASIKHEYETTGTIRPLNAASAPAREQQMRSWMGDTEYERYLQAIGQTTRIRVGDVESESVAANAGIESGDEILTYAGQRVFNLRDLNALMLRTPEGETVSTTVVRGGQQLELYVTGGPLGISQAPGR